MIFLPWFICLYIWVTLFSAKVAGQCSPTMPHKSILYWWMLLVSPIWLHWRKSFQMFGWSVFNPAIILTLDLHKNNIVYSDVRVVYITNKAIRLWRLIRFNDILIGITIIITVLVIKFENSWLSTADLAVLNKIPTSWDYLVAITWPLKGSSSNQYLSTLLMLCTA